MKKITKIGAILTAIGIIFCFAVYAASGFSVNAISINGTLQQNSQNISKTSQNIVINNTWGEIDIATAPGDEIVIVYYEDNYQTYDISEKGDTLYITKNYIQKKWYENVSFTGFGFNINNNEDVLQLLIPQNFAHDISIAGSVCDVELQKISANSIDIDIANCSLDFDSVDANAITAQIINGVIDFDSLKSDDIEVNCVNGVIEGTIDGDVEDYTISSSITFGSNNLPENSTGITDKTLSATCVNGSIEVTFSN